MTLRAVLAGALALLWQPGAPALAQSRKIEIVRDAEIEQLLRDYASPLLKAAKVNAGATPIFIVSDRSFNAFVADGSNIFVNVGALIETASPNEMVGVLAHEIGHIAGGHLARRRMQLDRAAIMAVAGMLASAGALVATSRSRNVGMDGAGPVGVMLGPQEIIQRSLLAYARGEEQAADVVAVKYLEATGQSAAGLLTTLERFNRDSMFRSQRIDPYLLSHPLPMERLSFLSEAARRSPHFASKDPPARQLRHDMARAKLIGFIGDVGETARRYPISDQSAPARYARAIDAYRSGALAAAMDQIDALLRAQPKNPYFHELKGQMLLESGRAREATAPLRRAAAMAPSGAPIRLLLAHALVSSNDASAADEAIRLLNRLAFQEPDNPDIFQFLSMAYYRKGDTGMAQVSAAQALFILGKYVEARTQADRAKRVLPANSPGWLKADDILTWRPPRNQD